MAAILCDHDIQGQFKILLSIWKSSEWTELWEMLECSVHTFRSLDLPTDMTDVDLWQLCQSRQFFLLTGNRNADTDDSLEITIRRFSRPDCLPVITIADAKRIMVDRHYSQQVASQMLEILYDVERVRGTRRLFVP